VTALAGASLADRVVARFRPGPTLVGCLLLTNLALLTVPLAAGPLLAIILFVGAGQLADAPAVVYEIAESSVIQSAAPAALIGRVVASHGFVASCAMLGGTVVGGLLGELLGARGAMLVGAVGSLVAVAWLAASPVRSLRAMPTTA
jgi:predicted MFS family arabinose efflux permease